MQNIIELLMVAALIIGAITILRFIWPLLLFIALAIAAYGIYMRWQIKKQLKQQQDFVDMNRQFNEYQQNRQSEEYETVVTSNEIIEAEYTEKEVE